MHTLMFITFLVFYNPAAVTKYHPLVTDGKYPLPPPHCLLPPPTSTCCSRPIIISIGTGPAFSLSSKASERVEELPGPGEYDLMPMLAKGKELRS